MGSEAETRNDSVQITTNSTSAPPPKPNNPAAVKKVVALGKEIRKQPDKTKADAAREMYVLIAGEAREIIVQAFVDGAGLTPKGAQTVSPKAVAILNRQNVERNRGKIKAV